MLVMRDGKTRTLKVKVGNRSGGMPTVHPQTPPVDPHTFGMDLAPRSSTLAKQYKYKTAPAEGMFITAIDPRSDAAEKGLKEGMVLLDINGTLAKDLTVINRYLAKRSTEGRAIRLRVTDASGNIRFVVIKPLGK